MSKNLYTIDVPIYIQSKFQDYCYNCPMPDLYFERDTVYAGNEEFITSHTIKCQNEKFCERIKKHLERITKDDKE